MNKSSASYDRLKAQETFLANVRIERLNQDNKWGVQTHNGHTWVAILTEEVGEFSAAVNEGRLAAAVEELVQVAAVACAAYEQQESGEGTLHPEWLQDEDE